MFPKPTPSGVFAVLLAVLCFIIGYFRHEIALVLIACIFSAILGYCFIALLTTELIFRERMKKHASFHAVLSEKINKGGQVAVSIAHRPRFLRFLKTPGILVRYEVELLTADKKLIRHIFDPLRPDGFTVKERGAYYRNRDAVVFSDAMGFFQLKNVLPSSPTLPLLVLPNPAEAAVSPPVRGGDTRSIGAHILKGESLVDHRPYVPGDDPRRINWKLFGHAGDLFVREEERTPPFHSSVLLFLDTRADEPYTDSARQAVDKMCEKALFLARAWTVQGIDVHLGFTGEEAVRPEESADFAEILAFPAACVSSETLPVSNDERSVFILDIADRERRDSK
ncbi:MAG: DUF58 domain-containing protein [Treponema sp.]|jgi:uncharacterized protein (DUF58 family)|nr:DUF58 domain-containing protein [Treponema sp.]